MLYYEECLPAATYHFGSKEFWSGHLSGERPSEDMTSSEKRIFVLKFPLLPYEMIPPMRSTQKSVFVRGCTRHSLSY